MNTIIRGTTPTIRYTFRDVDPDDIAVAYLTIEHKGGKIEKDLTDATQEETALSWTLTQAETLSLPDKVTVMLNWRLEDGTRGASTKTLVLIDSNLKEVVI